MFDTKCKSQQSLSSRAADAADLVIDFATLGEYGLEPVFDSPAKPCEVRRRSASLRSTGSWSAAVDRFVTTQP